QNIPLQIRVYDHFQQVVASRDETLNLPPGKHTRELTFAAQDAKRFRTEARWRAGNDAWQTAMAYADVDYLASGPRRLRRVEEGAWQRLVPESAPPGPPVYPPQGEWTDTSFPLRPDWSETSHWTWFRQEIASEQWLAGDTVELRIAQADFHCHVYLNGEKVGQHMGAATPFSFDVTAQWKFNQLNLLEIAVGSFTTTFADFSKDEWYNCLTPGVSSRRAQLGIWEGVAVVAHAGVFIDDVFVMPSVQKGELRVRTWLRNGGGEMARVVLRHTVEDEGKPALALPEQTVTLGPGRTRMVETIEPWAAPKLWWPHSPHLYRLRSQLASADGQPVDELSTRFGFREIRLEGMNVLFNERIFRPFSGGMGSGRPTTTRVTRDNLSEHCARKHPYPGEPLLLRTHQSPHARWQMEVADEMGVCIEAESQFNSVVVNATNDPRFWRNAAQHLREYVERDRNSPAVVLWSISNEVLHSSGVSQTPRDTLAAEMKKLAMMVKEIDPTRPVVEEGGADLDGTWEMLDMHYPRKWFNHVDFPNYCFWFEPGGMTGTGGQAPIVRWDGDKPVSIGEEGSYFQSRTPHDMATYAGDSIYTEPGGYGVSARCSEIDDMVEAGLLEAYRQVGVWRIAPDMGGSGGPQMRAAQKRVRTFAWPRDDRFLSGAIVQRRLSVFYDVLQPEELQLVWQVKSFTADRASNAVYEELVGGQQVTLQLEAGQIVHREIKFRCPAVEQPTKLRLTVQLLKEDQEVFQEEHDYWVYPVEQIELPEGAHIGLYDPSGATAEVLSEMGASDLVKIDRLEADSLAGLQALIIGEELPREPTGAKEVLAAFVQSGGKVIMLRQHQAMGLDWLPISGLRREDSMQHTYCFVRAPDHPIMAGVDDQLLRLWSPDHVVSTDTLAKHAGHN
ncbi:MAG: hypothetical protein KAW89_10985, partial [Armatimonadetes bacterium]|nr:hypothetical protein [Armatimonadota bacterium]